MYRYDEFDAEFVRQRVAQFRDQVERRISGELTEDEFKPLRLMNGVYLQLHAYMLRIAIPYGTLSSRQMRKLAHIARRLRPRLRPFHHAPEPAVQLAQAVRHPRHPGRAGARSRCTPSRPPATASATSPPTTSPAPPPTRWRIRAPYAEIIRQWSSLHPEFSFLPRKFKVAVTASEHDRAAMQVHDIGLHLKRHADGGLRLCRLRRRRQGRTPHHRQADPRRPAGRGPAELPRSDPARLQSARPARQHLQGAHQDPGARDRRRGLHRQVEEEWQRIRDGALKLPQAEIAAHQGLLRPAGFREPPGQGRAARAGPRLRPLGDAQHARPQAAGLCHRHHLAQAHRRHSRRRLRRADGRHRRPGRALFLRRGARHPRAEPGAAARAPRATCGRSTRR